MVMMINTIIEITLTNKTMIDFQQIDEQLLQEAFTKYATTDEKTGIYYDFDRVTRELLNKKNEQLRNLFYEQLDHRIDELAQERVKDISGIPVRTLIAKDIVTTMMGNAYLKTDIKYKDMAKAAVDLTDELLKALNK